MVCVLALCPEEEQHSDHKINETDDDGLVVVVVVTDVLRQHFFRCFPCKRGLCCDLRCNTQPRYIYKKCRCALLHFSFTWFSHSFHTLFGCSVNVHLSDCIKVTSILLECYPCFGDYYQFSVLLQHIRVQFPPSSSFSSVVSFFVVVLSEVYCWC